MTTKILIRDLIEIPERVHKGDFVLKLAEGVNAPTATLRDYVVTEQLVACFKEALGFIRSALDGKSSKAAYLHGSFGSGKSHFMAVLHLLLQHNPDARSLPALAPVIAANPWLQGKKLLLVPYHMIGARSMESAVLGHYVEYVQKKHPGSPLPGVFLAERIFEDARNQRQLMGDEAFFRGLNAGSEAGSGGDGWGAIGARWDAAGFEAALASAPRSPERTRLVADLVSTLFKAYKDVAKGGEEAFVSLDEGLAILSRHAKSLGYDGLVLFLDELILWLASHVADMGFVAREGQKLAKLVESATADRPVPIISFVARQRDLRELVGEHVPGAERLGFADVLKYWEGRFHTITLEDRNLPEIAEKRVLRPRSEEARRTLDAAFAETLKLREDIMAILLTPKSTQKMFRQVYPFSPALVETLIAVSSVLQRERTALKVMMQLLVSRQNDLVLGDIIPVGDLFDVIAEGDEPFTEDMRIHFDNAKRLYVQKLVPLLEREAGMAREQVQALAANDPCAVRFRTDDRLIKTLLLAALVPEVDALKNMTPRRLAALNHGTLRAPIAGQEAQLVLTRCRKWAGDVGEIKIGEDPTNPTIQVQLTGVDTEGIIEKARSQDNFGNRRSLLKKILFDQIGIGSTDELFVRHEFVWHGTRRSVEVVFGNIRELPEDSLKPRGDEWRVIIDFPFDSERHQASDDIAKIESFRSRNEPTRTFCWVPHFFGHAVLRDLGTLAVLEYILKGDRFQDYAAHLNAVDRTAARSLLDNQRGQLKTRLITCIEAAYGVLTPPPPDALVQSHDLADCFQSLDPAFRPLPPAETASMNVAFKALLGQMMAHQFPAHPKFHMEEVSFDELRPAQLKKALQEILRATAEGTGRLVVEKENRALLRVVANPLGLGEMTPGDAFLLGDRWPRHFMKKAAEERGEMTVKRLRRWTDDPTAMGLSREVQDLVILVAAEQMGRSLFQHGAPVAGAIGNLDDEVELREQRLPAAPDWQKATAHASRVLGVPASPLLSAANVAQFASEVRKAVDAKRADVEALAKEIRERIEYLGGASAQAARLKTANAVLGLVSLCRPDVAADEFVRSLARTTIETSAEAMGASFAKAREVLEALRWAEWQMFDALANLRDERAAAATAIRAAVLDALTRDELAQELGTALKAGQAKAVALLAKVSRPPAPVESPPAPGPGRKVVASASSSSLKLKEARQTFKTIEKSLAEKPDRVVTLSWSIEEDA